MQSARCSLADAVCPVRVPGIRPSVTSLPASDVLVQATAGHEGKGKAGDGNPAGGADGAGAFAECRARRHNIVDKQHGAPLDRYLARARRSPTAPVPCARQPDAHGPGSDAVPDAGGAVADAGAHNGFPRHAAHDKGRGIDGIDAHPQEFVSHGLPQGLDLYTSAPPYG